MSRWQLWVNLTFAALLVALVSSCATALALWPPQPYAPPKPKAALTDALGGQTWEASSKEFDRRVKARFPAGTAERAMTLELRRQGFKRQDWSYEKHGEDEATAFRSENNLVCQQGAFVYWRADAAGKIETIRGEYRELGCL
jgi:hypothetical protein